MTKADVIERLEEMKNYYLKVEYCDLRARDYYEWVGYALELLREREPVQPVNVRLEMGINGGDCPKCMNWVQRAYNYCPFCGKAVKWDE